MLLLPHINGIEPQVKAREMIIYVLVEIGSVKARGAYPSVTLGQRGAYSSSSRGTAPELPGRLEPPSKLAPLGPTSPPPPTSPPWLGPSHRLTPGRYHHQKSNYRG